MTTRCTDKWLVVMVCLVRTAELLNCTVQPQGDGTALYQISEPAKPNMEYDWKINGFVVAHESGSDGTIVLKHNEPFLLLKAYYLNTTYTVDTAEGPVTVPCYDPASSSLREPLHDANNQSRGLALNTTDPASSNPHDANKLNWGIILAIVVFAILVIAVLVITLLFILPVGICWRKKKGFPCRCFRKEEEEEQGNQEAAEGML